MFAQDIGEGPTAKLKIVDEPAFANPTPDQLLDRLPSESHQTFLFIVGHESTAKADHPILVLDLAEQKGRSTFRSAPTQIQAVENNLSIANMDFTDFADAVDEKRCLADSDGHRAARVAGDQLLRLSHPRL